MGRRAAAVYRKVAELIEAQLQPAEQVIRIAPAARGKKGGLVVTSVLVLTDSRLLFAKPLGLNEENDSIPLDAIGWVSLGAAATRGERGGYIVLRTPSGDQDFAVQKDASGFADAIRSRLT